MLKRLIKRLRYNFYHAEMSYWYDVLDDLILDYAGNTPDAAHARARIAHCKRKLSELY